MKNKLSQPTEHEIQTAILDYLHSKAIFCWRNNSGAVFSEYKGRKRMIKYGLKGSADILGILKNGRFLAIEVKNEKGKLSEEQGHFLAMIKHNGGIGFVAKNLDNVLKKIK